MTGQKLTLDGGGVSKRVFIHMRDVADATLKIALSGRLGETYHISGYDLISIRELVEIILGKLGQKFEECVRGGSGTAWKRPRVHARQLKAAYGARLEG